MGLTVEQINSILEDLSFYTLKRKFTLVAQEEDNWGNGNLGQGDVGTIVSIFKLNIEDLHLKVEASSDSYGDNQGIQSIKIVKPVTKQVTNFE